ncbi:hypothetical protein LOK49_LG09G01051 [Camellia lanceoleosa]|uniref:Uncharacterized protein n=1 Tax=Camellia lanceoleosa TaxID=1840588 RepID=A0ACC0GJF6_9ERIC|nr:hypothetical protein LOK49_LG09G01051 [Camellia lanceoleosa]
MGARTNFHKPIPKPVLIQTHREPNTHFLPHTPAHTHTHTHSLSLSLSLSLQSAAMEVATMASHFFPTTTIVTRMLSSSTNRTLVGPLPELLSSNFLSPPSPAASP